MNIHQKVIYRLSSENTNDFVERVTEKANDIVTYTTIIGNPPKECKYPRNDVRIINISYLDKDTAVIVYQGSKMEDTL